MTANESEELIAVGDVSLRLGVLPHLVDRAARANKIPYVRVGSRLRAFRVADLEKIREALSKRPGRKAAAAV